MNFWSDYKAGCLTESEYTSLCNREAKEEEARMRAKMRQEDPDDESDE